MSGVSYAIIEAGEIPDNEVASIHAVDMTITHQNPHAGVCAQRSEQGVCNSPALRGVSTLGDRPTHTTLKLNGNCWA